MSSTSIFSLLAPAAVLLLSIAACAPRSTGSVPDATSRPARPGNAAAATDAREGEPTNEDHVMADRETTEPTRAAPEPRSGAPVAATETAILAGGCFWGMEDILRKEPGVLDTEVGYTGGTVKNATYENHEGHAEAIKIVFDPTQTSYAALLDLFFRMHDPTTKNRQGNDVGSSYRSAIFTLNDTQKKEAEAAIGRANASGRWKRPVVTEVTKAGEWWSAEGYHQDYLVKHPGGYTCHFLRD